jgi:hypothetical protein
LFVTNTNTAAVSSGQIDRRGKVVTSGQPGEVFAKAREIAAE